QNEAVITQWAPALLLMELDGVLWRESNDIQIKKLWEYLCTYCYLPRLANENVLEEAIRTGLNSTEYFAFASAFDGTRYIDLKFSQHIGAVEHSGYLVKVSVAQKQIADEQQRQAESAQGTSGTGTGRTIPENFGSGGTAGRTTAGSASNTGSHETPENPPVQEQPKNTSFYMSAQLDNTRINRDVQRLVEEVISHLTAVDGCQVEVSLELNAKSTDGLSPQIVRTISENCQTLKVRDFGFEE
ncbi:MAG: hypothetical protein LBT08_00590, partial [Synergistaceae bacterium]|nr:hypothetical protein [Synergistaceae bacterium]